MRAKRKERPDAGQEAQRFSKFLKEKMDQHKVSVAKLSAELRVACKSIYRYINAENPPSPQIERDIRDYFKKLDKKMIENKGLRYADEGDLTKEEISRLAEELYEEECDAYNEAAIHAKVKKQADDIRDGIGYYSRAVQDYIVNNLILFCEVLPRELSLVEQLCGMDGSGYQEAVAYLEEIPMDIGMLIAQEDMNEEERISLFLQQLRRGDALPSNKFSQIREGQKGSVSKEMYDKLCQGLEELAYCGIAVPSDILARIKVMLDYTVQEWYLLFLYERMLRSDLCEPDGCRFQIGEQSVGKKEYLFLRYLEVLDAC